MVFDNQLHEPIKKMPALFISQSINSFRVVSNCKDTLPSCNRIGSNNRMDGSKLISGILRRTPRARVELEFVVFGAFVENWLRKSSSQSFQKLLVRF